MTSSYSMHRLDSSLAGGQPQLARQIDGEGSAAFLRRVVKRKLRNHAYTDAIFNAERLVAMRGSVSDVTLLAECYFASGQFKRLYSFISTRCGQILPQNSDQSQLDDITYILESDSALFRLQYLYGLCCMQLRNWRDAKRCFSQLIRCCEAARASGTAISSLSKIESDVYYNMGVVLKHEENVSLAVQHLRRAVELDPIGCPNALQLLCSLGEQLNVQQLYCEVHAPRIHVMYTDSAKSLQEHFEPMAAALAAAAASMLQPQPMTPIRPQTSSAAVNQSRVFQSPAPRTPAASMAAPSSTRKPPVSAARSTSQFNISGLSGISDITGGAGAAGMAAHNLSSFSFQGAGGDAGVDYEPFSTPTNPQRQHAMPSAVTPSALNTPVAPTQQIMRPITRNGVKPGGPSATVSTPAAAPTAPAAAPVGRPPKAVMRMTFESPIAGQQQHQTMPPQQQHVQTPAPATAQAAMQTQDINREFSIQDVADCLKQYESFAMISKLVGDYRCREALEEMQRLPVSQQQTGWILQLAAQCYFEMNSHQQAEHVFERQRQLEPYRLEGMELYSTLLWHQRRIKDLAGLTHSLNEQDRLHPSTLLTTGNCFSLQQEHAIAKRFFKRAQKVAPNMAYAYTLEAHEHLSCDELDLAEQCYQQAMSRDPRHYNAWYGLGEVYSRKEEYKQALVSYKRAVSINPSSAGLHFSIGLTYLALREPREAYHELQSAINLFPGNALIRFQLAQALMQLNRFDTALEELDELRKATPHEPDLHIARSKCLRSLGQHSNALHSLQIALDLATSRGDHAKASAVRQMIEQLKQVAQVQMHQSHMQGEEASTDDVEM